MKVTVSNLRATYAQRLFARTRALVSLARSTTSAGAIRRKRPHAAASCIELSELARTKAQRRSLRHPPPNKHLDDPPHILSLLVFPAVLPNRKHRRPLLRVTRIRNQDPLEL